MCTSTSPASISTQSQAGMPSTRALPKPRFFISWMILSAIDPTCRCERPDVMIIVSASEVLPARSIAIVSSAFMSSRHSRASAFRSSERA